MRLPNTCRDLSAGTRKRIGGFPNPITSRTHLQKDMLKFMLSQFGLFHNPPSSSSITDTQHLFSTSLPIQLIYTPISQLHSTYTATQPT